jgi:peroxiredoxin (alkyl hydroperoxide reductase subunit C)
LKAYQADIAKFESTDTQVFGMSVDSVPANREFAKQIGIAFPLLSDFKRTVVKDYGVFNEEQGFGNRATFLIDKEGIIRHIDEGNVAVDPTTVADACNVLMHKKTASP